MMGNHHQRPTRTKSICLGVRVGKVGLHDQFLVPRCGIKELQHVHNTPTPHTHCHRQGRQDGVSSQQQSPHIMTHTGGMNTKEDKVGVSDLLNGFVALRGEDGQEARVHHWGVQEVFAQQGLGQATKKMKKNPPKRAHATVSTSELFFLLLSFS